ncbi:MAG TPA: di-heme oxidoredictase family protein [Bryobacteraceae bacterium]|nr:di-heme oxidoredictase family protein [Bryobacteraceae bacterium]
MHFSSLLGAGNGWKSLFYVAFAGVCLAQVDPGPRAGAAGAGGYYPTLNATEQAFFTAARTRFQEIDSVSGNVPGEAGVGLGPTFNANSCAACHAQPTVGGTSPAVNPQVAFAKLGHPTPDPYPQIVPSFITANGPVREARFVLNPDGSLDGGVHGLYTIAGRTDAPGCTLAQPDFASELANRNVIFRIPTPTFGLGLVENTPDATLRANLSSTAAQRAALGIQGTLNTSGNDGTVTRFGWKAQNKSLLIFAGEAYNVEQGVSNEVFMNERSAVPGCVFNQTPEDAANMIVSGTPPSEVSAYSADTVNFAAFMRLTAPPTPTTSTPSQLNGQALFKSIGCVLCHTQSLTTGASIFTGMSNVTYHPYSDFAVHHMGSSLADGIVQGAAGPDQFRTAPLWGLGQRLFFLHDGRTSNLLQAIQAHASPAFDCVISASSDIFEFEPSLKVFAPTSASTFCGSEADKVIANFNALSGGPTGQKQELLNFLRSL